MYTKDLVHSLVLNVFSSHVFYRANTLVKSACAFLVVHLSKFPPNVWYRQTRPSTPDANMIDTWCYSQVHLCTCISVEVSILVMRKRWNDFASDCTYQLIMCAEYGLGSRLSPCAHFNLQGREMRRMGKAWVE